MRKEIVSTSPVGLRDFAVGQEYSVFPLPNRLVNFLGNMFEEESKYMVLEEIKCLGQGLVRMTLWLVHCSCTKY